MEKKLEKHIIYEIEVAIDPSLNNLPIPKVVQEKIARAKATLAKHPIPEHLLKSIK